MVDPSPSSDDDVFALTKSATAQAAAASSISAPSCVTPDSISVVASAGFPLRQRDYPSNHQPRDPAHQGCSSNGIFCPGGDMCAHAARQILMQQNVLLCAILQAAVENHALVRGARAHYHVCLMSLTILDNLSSTIAAAAPLASVIQTQLRESSLSRDSTIDFSQLRSIVRSILSCGAVDSDEKEAAVFSSTALFPPNNAAVEHLNQVPMILRHLFDIFSASSAEERSSHSLIRAAFSHGTELFASRLLMKLLPLENNIELVAQMVAANYAAAWSSVIKSCDDKAFFNSCFVDGGVSHASGLAMCARPLMRFCVGATMGLCPSQLLPPQPVDHIQNVSFLTRHLGQFYSDVADRSTKESGTNSGVLHPCTAFIAWKCVMNIAPPDRFYNCSHLADGNCSLLSFSLPCNVLDCAPSELFTASQFHVLNRQRHLFSIPQESAL